MQVTLLQNGHWTAYEFCLAFNIVAQPEHSITIILDSSTVELGTPLTDVQLEHLTSFAVDSKTKRVLHL